MTSMKYCMYENTAAELLQVVHAMDEANVWDDLDLNEYERHAKERLYDLCQNYITLYDRLEEEEEQ